MVVLAKGELEQIALTASPPPLADVASVDLSAPAGTAARALVAACEEDGFFRVTGHGVPLELVRAAEAAAAAFFALPQPEKETEAATLGYGSKQIGGNGDLGWVEYLLLAVTHAGGAVPAVVSAAASSSTLPCAAAAASAAAASSSSAPAGILRCLLDEYAVAVRRMACAVLELMAEGLGLAGGELARLVARADSDCMLRVNHYPPRPDAPNLTGFGEHTDPQIISVLRSNGTSGLEVARRDGNWAAVPPDRDAFFVNVGDTLQVLTNRRFRSVRHRVVVNSERSRVSMILFAGPPPDEKLAPLLGDGGRSRYREFTWTEFKASGCRTRLEEDRLARFEN